MTSLFDFDDELPKKVDIGKGDHNDTIGKEECELAQAVISEKDNETVPLSSFGLYSDCEVKNADTSNSYLSSKLKLNENENNDALKSEAARLSNPAMAMKRKSCTSGTEGKKQCREDFIQLLSHAHGRKGERDEMQDYHILLDNIIDDLPDLAKSELKRVAYFAVFDGHAGARASKFAAERLHEILIQKFPRGNKEKIEKELKKCLVDTFKKVDEDFLQRASKQKPFWKDGTTATILLVVDNTLYIASIGDSKAVLCRENQEGSEIAIQLTKDHNPTLYEERMRIQKAGGTVRDGRVNGVLEVSRSIGDGQYKKLGVTCIPDVKKCLLTDRDKYVLVACDGLWKSFSNEQALSFVKDVMNDDSLKCTERRSLEDVRGETLCSRLSAAAVKRLSGDNVTVILIQVIQST